MIIYNIKQVRVFNGNGLLKEKVLLLKLFNNNNSIKQILNFSKIVEIQLKILLNLNELLSYFIVDLNLFKFLNKNKKLTIFLLKKLLIFYFFKIYKKILLGNSSYLSKFFKEQNITKFKTFKFISKLLKKKIVTSIGFKKNFLKKKNDLKLINDKSIFILGEVYDYYRGSVTPFYNSKFSWFVSTGLKMDLECGDVNVLMDHNKDFHLENKFKSIIVKLYNFKTYVKSNIKKKVRHVFFYNFSNFFGVQRFISESKTSFNIKQLNLIQQFLFLQKIKVNKVYSFFSFSFNDNLVNINFLYHFFDNYIKKYINLHQLIIKFFLILFKSSKIVVNYYLLLINEVTFIIDSFITVYRSLFSFINLKPKYFKTLKVLFNSIYVRYLYNKFKLLRFNFLKLELYFVKFLLLILYIFQLNFLFLKKFFNYVFKYSFFDIFFSVYLLRKKRQKLINSLNNVKLSISEKTQIYIKLLEKPYWVLMYKNFFYYFYFLIDWKINFDLIIKSFNLDVFFSYLTLLNNIKKPFRELRIKWHITFFINIKELYIFFFDFLEELLLNIQKLLYFYFFKIKNLNNLFIFSNLYIYLYKLRNKDLNNNSLFLTNIIKLSSFFLGKWFYNRYLHKFFDNKINYNYNFYKNFLDFKLRDFITFKSGNNSTLIKSKKMFKKNLKKILKKNLTKILTKNLKKKLKKKNIFFFNKLKLIFKLKQKVYNYRSFFLKKKENIYINNFLKKGTFFKLPKIPSTEKLWSFNKLSELVVIKLPKKRELLNKYNKFYLNKFKKMKVNIINLSNVFLILYKNFKLKQAKKYSYYNFWFLN